MRIKHLVRKAFFGGWLICLGSTPVSAATITHSTSWSITPTPGAGPIIQNQNFERFDPTLGTLTQVEWSVNASLAAHFTVTSAIGLEFDYDLSAIIKCSIEGIGCEDPFSDTKSQAITGFAQSGPFGSSEPKANRTINLLFVGTNSTNNPLDLNYFTSTTPLNLELMAMTSVFVQTCIQSPFGETCVDTQEILEYDGDYSGTLNYTYTYDPVVPIPAAVWLFGSGLIGLIGVARRKKA
jgi:hypothetical protein